MADSHDHTTFEYNRITEHIFVGTNLCCQVHFDDELLKQGITADLSVEGERVDAPFGVEFFAWIPVVDNDAPTPDQFALGVSTLQKLVALDKKVYAHCEHGHGRAPTMVAAYFIAEGDSVDDAIARIKEKRPVVHLSDAQYSALNVFAEQA